MSPWSSPAVGDTTGCVLTSLLFGIAILLSAGVSASGPCNHPGATFSWRLHEVADVLTPRGEPAHQQAAHHQVHEPRDGPAVDPQASRWSCDVERSSPGVDQHGPEPSECLRRNALAELGDIPLEVGADEVLTPPEASAVV